MLETVGFGDGGKVLIAARVDRLAVYLDTHSIINLSKADADLRDRATAIFRNGADLLFSTTHAAELARLRGRTSALVRSFLDELGHRWIPVDGNGLATVLDREQETPSDRGVCIAGDSSSDTSRRAAYSCMASSAQNS